MKNITKIILFLLPLLIFNTSIFSQEITKLDLSISDEFSFINRGIDFVNHGKNFKIPGKTLQPFSLDVSSLKADFEGLNSKFTNNETPEKFIVFIKEIKSNKNFSFDLDRDANISKHKPSDIKFKSNQIHDEFRMKFPIDQISKEK